jgi:hypothetical protein
MVLRIQARAAEAGLPFRVETATGSPPDRILRLAGVADGLGAATHSRDDRDSAPVTGA